MKSIGQVYNDLDIYNFVYDFYDFCNVCQIAMIFHIYLLLRRRPLCCVKIKSIGQV